MIFDFNKVFHKPSNPIPEDCPCDKCGHFSKDWKRALELQKVSFIAKTMRKARVNTMTLEQVEQRLSALKEEQDKLTAELERLKSEQAEVKPWRAEKNAGYYILQNNGDICCFEETGFVIDTTRHKIGNYYRNRELAEQDAKELALRGRVRQLRDALCEGYHFKVGEKNWYITCFRVSNIFQPMSTTKFEHIGDIYFDTYEHAQQASDILNKEFNN